MAKKLLKQVTLRKDVAEYDQMLFPLPIGWLKRSGGKKGDFLNVYEEDANTITVKLEKNPFGTPEEIPTPGRKKAEE